MAKEKHYLNLNAVMDDNHHHLTSLMDDYTFYASGMREMEEGKKAAAAQVIEYLQRAGWDGLEWGTERYQVQTVITRTLVKEKLLERGVSPEIIDFATRESTSAPFLRGYPVGKAKKEEGG